MHKKENLTCDVLVIGGGPGGLSAAISAARNGANVIIVERSSALGGAAQSGLGVLGFIDRNGKKAIGGLAQEYIDRMQIEGGTMGHFRCPAHNSITPILPDVFKIVAVEMCQQAGIRILFNFELLDVMVENNQVSEVSVYGKCTEIIIKAKVFIDGTGDGDLAYMVGIPFISGQDGTGINQPATLMFTVSDYDIDQLFNYIENNPDELGIKEKYAKGYDLEFFRTTPGYCLVGLNRLIEKAKQAGDFDIPRKQFNFISTPNSNQLSINTVRIINIDGSDPIQVSAALVEGYRQIGIIMNFMRKYLPGFEKAVISQISPLLGVRESRHFEGIRRLTKEEVFSYHIDNETIALCAYNVDIHSGISDYTNLTPIEKPFGIPLGCMIPKSIDNLIFTGRTISVDTTAYGAIRIMSTIFALGEAAGVTAAICAKEKTRPEDVDIARVRYILLAHGAILDTN